MFPKSFASNRHYLFFDPKGGGVGRQQPVSFS